MMFASLNVLSQSIIVNTQSQTVPQLVNDVLINSPCITAQNITWRTGTDFGSSNGIGYFTNNNPNFPMTAGVILSTGNVANSVGPNSSSLNDGSSAWLGDADLEGTLAASGIIMNSTNATVLEFDFTSVSTQFDLDFVFASEEYGNYQCEFSDAFAFLLTNMTTGVTTNLAVVPNTNLPISVVTIRDFLYNSSCTSENPEYFGRFNGGSNSTSSATNFNGQTVLMTASTLLTPNTPYHIKLVIADRGDYKSDSAIFIAADSFNVGQFALGSDLLVSNNSAICFGESHLLDTALNPADYTFVWRKNGTVIAGQNGSTLLVTSPGTYSVTYTKIIDGCLPETDSIIVQYYPAFQIPNPKKIRRCDTGAATYEFDLSQNNPVVTAGLPANTAVTYHLTLEDAQNNINALTENYSGTANQTIFVRVVNPTTGCIAIKSFILEFLPAAVAYQAPNLEKCERSSTQHNAVFNLNDNKTAILNGQNPADYTVTYHSTAADAAAGLNPLSTSFLSAGQTIYVRVQNNSDAGCFSVGSFELIIKPAPAVDSLPNVIVCTKFVLPILTNGTYHTAANGGGTTLNAGTSITTTQTIYIYNQSTGANTCSAGTSFKVTVIDPVLLTPPSGSYCGKYQLPTLAYGQYRTQANGGGTVLAQGSFITATQTIYVYYQTVAAPICEINTNFNVTIYPEPILADVQDVFDCTAYSLPPLTVGNYYTAANGGGTQIPAGTQITTTQEIFIYAVNAGPLSCSASKKFTIYIGDLTPQDINQCEPYELPVLPIGQYFTGPNGTGQEILAGTLINTSQTIYIAVDNNNQPCATNVEFHLTISQPQIDTLQDVTLCGGYELPVINNGTYYTETNGGGTILSAGDFITSTKTIYIYAVSIDDCSNESSFTVTINDPAQLDSRADIDICNSYTLTPLVNGNYYTGPGGTGQLLPGGTIIYESQIIYVYNSTNSTPSCTAETSFELFIFAVDADDIGDITICDQYVLPELINGNYYANPGGPSPTNTMLNAGDIITASTTLYIYIESGERIVCSDENVVNITINVTPDVLPMADVENCDSYILPNLAVGNYFTAPNGGGIQLNPGDAITNSQIIYIFAETATTPNCFDQESFMVKIYNVSELPDLTTCESYKLPNLSVGNYYTQSGGNGNQIPAGTTITQSGTYYIYGVSPFANGCTDETDFVLTIVPQPQAFNVPITMTTLCDEDGINDGVFNFDLTPLAATVLGAQTGVEFSVTFHESQFYANQNLNPVTSSTKPNVFARVSNALAPNCYDTVKISIFVKKLPEPTFKDAYICIDSATQTLLSPTTIQSGLNAATHTFVWKNSSGVVIGTQANYIATLPGTYNLTATSTLTSCTSTRTVTLNPSEPATITYTTSPDFADQSFVTITATGVGGNYEYQIDNGPFQNSPTFYNLSSGIHIITVRDKNGCGNTTSSVLIINYPHYFTPNGDGANDTWNIPDLRTAKNVRISILDRYGKLITKITPNGAGWDGMYNGNMLPSTDYWFIVSYEINNEQREFKSHFSLKR